MVRFLISQDCKNGGSTWIMGKDASTGALTAGGYSGDYRFENDGECMGDGASSNDWSASFCKPTEDKGKIILTSKT